MNQPPQTSKRIVSKGAYVQVQISRIGLICLMLGIIFAIFEFVGVALGSLLEVIPAFFYLHNLYSVFSNIFYAVIFTLLSFLLVKLNRCSAKQFTKMSNIIPFTRANTADLPAPDTLVRASEEPKLEPQAVLLRAATEVQERHEEQLLRATKENK